MFICINKEPIVFLKHKASIIYQLSKKNYNADLGKDETY